MMATHPQFRCGCGKSPADITYSIRFTSGEFHGVFYPHTSIEREKDAERGHHLRQSQRKDQLCADLGCGMIFLIIELPADPDKTRCGEYDQDYSDKDEG